MSSSFANASLLSNNLFQGDYWGLGMQAGNTTVAIDLNHILQDARMGDELAFSRLVDYYRSTAERAAQHILHTEEAAADAVQDALIKVHRALPRFQDGNFRSWLLRIVTNTCYDHLRRQKRRQSMSLDELTEGSTGHVFAQISTDTQNPETLALHKESMQVLLKAINELPTWHRTVVLLIDVQGYDYAEAAEILDLPLGTIKSRLSRARATLRDALLNAGLAPQHNN
ncbi:sigma-70 family RNA polymerase sigma factor [soil metagenome]